MNIPAARSTRLLFHPLAVCLCLAVAVLAVYLPVRNDAFVNYDDPAYFSANPHVLSGLSCANIKWAFTTGEQANWHPLTWLSLMLDAQFFGNGPVGPHLINALLHWINAVLVFFLLRQLTATVWRSAAVAMLFAIHPLHVESVAWVAERKDVLSGFFGLLTLLCYARYTGADADPRGRRRIFYSLAVFLFTCGLMSKPMLVTLPFVMLLLDFWPLQRFNPAALPRLVIEKIPFFILSVVASVVTYIVQQKGGAMSTFTVIPAAVRIENTFVSYARYLAKIICPINLATPYPPPHYWPISLVVLAAVLFIALCVAAIALRHRHPFVFTGWFWFAGMLVPVIGLIQVGSQSMADRYMYFPLIGILIIIVWFAGEVCVTSRQPVGRIIPVAVFLFLICAIRTRNQVGAWKNDETLFGHALAVTQNNYVASIDLGYWYSQQGSVQALNCYHNALQMAPSDPTALYDVGDALAKLGRWNEAIADYTHALQITPDQPDILNNLGFALAQTRQLERAAACFQAVLKLKPDSLEARINLAAMDYALGRYADAAQLYQAALQSEPNNPGLLIGLGDTLVRMNQIPAAAESYRRALELEPGNKAILARLKLYNQNPD